MTTRRPSQMDVGRAIRHILAETGANLARVARGAGLSTEYLGALSRGERIPSLPTLEDIAHALGVQLFVLACQGPAAGQRQRRGRASTITDRSVMSPGGATAPPTDEPHRPS